MAKSFVFLEIVDPEIVALVHGIRSIANSAPSRSGPHVTIRGPYSKPVPPGQLTRYKRLLDSSPVVLEGVGVFTASDRFAVYVKVQHDKLRQVWWKPDYPIKKFGFNPHVTLYEGDDRQRAMLLCKFLTNEKLKVLTWDFVVRPYVSDHKDLFQRANPLDISFFGLINKGQIRADFLARLERTLNKSLRAA